MTVLTLLDNDVSLELSLGTELLVLEQGPTGPTGLGLPADYTISLTENPGFATLMNNGTPESKWRLLDP